MRKGQEGYAGRKGMRKGRKCGKSEEVSAQTGRAVSKRRVLARHWYTCVVSVCAHRCAREHACVRARASSRASARECVCVCVCVCARARARLCWCAFPPCALPVKICSYTSYTCVSHADARAPVAALHKGFRSRGSGLGVRVEG